MSAPAPDRYEKAVREAVERLKADGWQVETEAIVPELGDLRVDYIARLGDQVIIGEVKYRGQDDLAQLGEIADQLERLPGARLEMTWLGRVEEPHAQSEIVRMAEAAVTLAGTNRAAALLLAWAALEGSLSSRASTEEPRAKPAHARRRLTEMANLGELSLSQFDFLNSIAQIRNRIAHGGYTQPDIEDIEYVSKIAQAVASDSLVPIEQMIDWFLVNYKDPAEGVPYDGKEGGYQYVNGGPYDAEEVLHEQFPQMPFRDIRAAAHEITRDGGAAWVGAEEY